MAGQNPLGTAFAQLPSGALGAISSTSSHEMHVNVGGKSLFMAANPTAVTTSAALATTYVGLCLSNPAGNTSGGKNINFLLRRVSGMFVVAPAAFTGVSLIVGYAAGGVTVHTTALTPFSALVGSTASVSTAKADSACTLVGTPIWSMPLASNITTTNGFAFNIDINGAIAIPPGGYVAIGTTIAGPTSGFFGGLSWQEVVSA